MHIRVIYQNDKYDYVTEAIFENFLTVSKIKKFFRRSEARWITVGVDTIRGAGGQYEGEERRSSLQLSAISEKSKNKDKGVFDEITKESSAGESSISI